VQLTYYEWYEAQWNSYAKLCITVLNPYEENKMKNLTILFFLVFLIITTVNINEASENPDSENSIFFKQEDIDKDGKIGIEDALFILQTIAKTTSDNYSIKFIENDSIKEHRFMFNTHHFMTLIDENGTFNFRPHPGFDINGWGSSWYAQPFLPGAKLRHTKINDLVADFQGIHVNAEGNISYGESSTYGTWKAKMDFNYNVLEKRIIGTGEYSIELDSSLSDSTGDLNLCKIASNFLNDVQLLDPPGGIGNTGDMSRVIVHGNGEIYPWEWDLLKENATFPYCITDYLSIEVFGEYNNVDTAAQGYEAIAPAYKPSIKVEFYSKDKSIEMIFGGIYDISKSQMFWEDNIGITPLILKQSTKTEFDFDLKFESTALPQDQ